jgi:hypothetical protein
MHNLKRERLLEEITKSEVDSLIRSQIDSNNKSSDLKKEIKKIVSDCLSEFTKCLWTKKSFWQNDVER